jgi:hypothetical protein
MQNAVKHLCCRKDKDKEKDKHKDKNKEKEKEKDNEPNILADFSACMFEYDDVEKFEEAFRTMRTKVEKQTLACSSEECCILIDDALESVGKKVDAKLKQLGDQSSPDKRCDTQVLPEKTNELLAAARLKKKSPRKKTKKGKRTWVEKFHKGKKKKGPTEVMEAQELPKVCSVCEAE